MVTPEGLLPSQQVTRWYIELVSTPRGNPFSAFRNIDESLTSYSMMYLTSLTPSFRGSSVLRVTGMRSLI